MSERGTDLMRKASQQLDEMAEFFGTLVEADLHKPCLKNDAGYTVGAVAAHAAEVSHYLGQFLQAAGYVPGSPVTGSSGSHDHRRAAPDALPLPELLDRVTGGMASIVLLADLTDEQLDSVPPAGSGRFSDGRRTLARAIDALIAHQAGLLMTLKRSVALADNHTDDTPHAHTHDGERHVHIERAHDHSGDSQDKGAAVRSRHRPGRHHINRVREHRRGFIVKKRAGLLVTGGGALATIHAMGGGALIHGVLPILFGVAIWQGAVGIVVGLLIAGVVLYLGVRRRLAKSGKESM